MGKRGPAKTPTSVLAQRGSWRGNTRHGEPRSKGSLVAPDGLTEQAGIIWEQLASRLEEIGVAGKIDSYAVGRYCTLYARWRECEDFIAKHGQVMPEKDSGGKLTGFKEFPQVARASRLADQLLKLEQQYGMTASARASLAVDTGSNKEHHGIAGSINPRLVG